MWTLMTTDALAPGASVPNEHFVGCSASPGTPALHAPVDGVTERICTAAGSESVMITFFAVDGPLFVTESVYEMSVPAVAFAGPVFVSDRSATAVTVRFTVALLLVASGSGVSLLTVATLLIS